MMSLSARWKRRGEKGDPFGWRCAELSHPCSSESGPKTKEGVAPSFSVSIFHLSLCLFPCFSLCLCRTPSTSFLPSLSSPRARSPFPFFFSSLPHYSSSSPHNLPPSLAQLLNPHLQYSHLPHMPARHYQPTTLYPRYQILNPKH